jgi:hypothetical protein
MMNILCSFVCYYKMKYLQQLKHTDYEKNKHIFDFLNHIHDLFL